MSAFLVENKTINKIANKVFSPNLDIYNTLEELKAIGIKDKETLGKELYKMNIEALNDRYGSAKDFANGLEYQFKIEANYSLISVFESLNCFMYQCSEGNIPNTKLYKIMETLENLIARKLVYDMPEYDTIDAWN